MQQNDKARYSGKNYESHYDFWKAKFAEIEEPFCVHGFYPTASASQAVQTVAWSLPKETVTQIKSIANDQDLGILVVLLSAIQQVFYFYESQAYGIIDTPCLKQGSSDGQEVVSLITSRLAGGMLKDLLNSMKETVVQSYQYQDFPAQSFFGNSPTSLSNVLVCFPSLHQEISKQETYDLTLSITHDGQGGLNLTVEAKCAQIDEAFLQAFQQHLLKMLHYLSTPEHSLNELQLLSDSELESLETFNKTEKSLPEPETLQAVIEQWAESTPDQIAILLPDHAVSYAELNAKANQFARYLKEEHGLQKEEPVAVLLNRSEWLPVAMLGIMKAGGSYLPIDPDYPAARITFMIEDAQARVLVVHSDDLFSFPDLSGELFAIDLQLEEVEEVTENVDYGVRSNQLAYVIYTSGSTGKPKGVMLEHKGFINMVYSQIQGFGVLSSDRIAQFASPSFDASMYETFMAFFAGATLCPIPKEVIQDSRMFEAYISEFEIDVITIPPVYLNLLDRRVMQRLKTIVTAGEAAVVQDALAYSRHLQYINAYGPTEDSVCASYHRVDPNRDYQGSIPIGTPTINNKIWVLGSNQELLPPGCSGEICLSGVGLARGYLNRPELTEEKFIAHPFVANERLYRTGDLGRWLPDGHLEFLGRIDDQIKIRGHRVELGEIKTTLVAHPQISDALVLAQNLRDSYLELIAYYVPQGETKESLNVPDLKKFLQDTLPAYMIPEHFVMLPEFPLTTSGKIDKSQLPNPLQVVQTQAEFAEARNTTETALVDIFCEILEHESIGIDDNFFELGGQSLKAIQILSRIQKQLGCTLNVPDLFAAPTIRELANVLDKMEKTTFEAIPVLPAQDDYPVSNGQKRFWVLDKIEPNKSTYNIPGAYILEGSLDVDAWQKAFQLMIERHESLRTSFVVIDGEPRQKIHHDVKWEIVQVDLSGEADPFEKARHLAQQEANTTFDLAVWPLMRTKLLQLQPDVYVFLLTLHHIISDGWSMMNMLNEIKFYYEALLEGKTDTLPTLPLQYRDYASWQQQMLANQDNPHAVFWKETLSGRLPVLDLPGDFPRPPQQTYDGNTLTFRWDTETVQSLRNMGKDQDASLHTCLLALVSALLYRYSGQNDMILGIPVAGRNHPDLEKQIGFYVNTILLRCFPQSQQSFLEHLDAIKHTMMQAMEHQAYPFDRIVEDLDLERDLSRSQLFDVMIDLANETEEFERIGGIQTKSFEYGSDVSKFDLSFNFSESEEELVLFLEYNTRIFRQERMERMGEHLGQLIQGVLANAHKSLQTLPLLTEQEQKKLLFEFNNTTTDFNLTVAYPALFEQKLASYYEEIAVSYQEEQLSYRDLDRQSREVAQLLKDEGLQAGELVGIGMKREPRFLSVILGILRAGGAYVPLELSYPQERIRYMLEDSRARILLFDETFGDTHSELLEGNAHLEVAIDVEGIGRQSWTLESSWDADKWDVNNPAYMIYTSGTTGRPKGALVHHAGALNHIFAEVQALQLPEGFRFLQTAPVSADISVWQFLAPLLYGGRVVICDQQTQLHPARLFQLIREEQITLVEFVPSVLHLLLEHIESLPESERALPDLQWLLVTGEAFPVALVNQWLACYPDIKVLNAYGPSEASDDVIQHVIEHPLKSHTRTVPIGKPIANMNAFVVDSQQQLLPLGVTGEIAVSGVGVGLGYWSNEEQTRQRFPANPFAGTLGDRLYLTGDLGRWLPDGTLEFLGRKDEQVQLRGYRIELEEIQQCLTQYPGIREAIVLLSEGQAGQPELVGYVISDETIVFKSLMGFLSQHLPGYMIPSHFIPMTEFPLTPSGTIDKLAFPRLQDVSEALRQDYVAPSSELEKRLCTVWEEVLERNQIGVQENFFEVGGNSLKAIVCISKLSEILRMEIPLSLIFQFSTIQEMAGILEDFDQLMACRNSVTLLNQPADRKIFAMPIMLGYGMIFKQLSQFFPDCAWYTADFIEDENRLEQYVQMITEIQPKGPYVFFGYSSGGALAFELAKFMEAQGHEVSDIIMLDSGRNLTFLDQGEVQTKKNVEALIQFAASFLESDEDTKVFIHNPYVRERMARIAYTYMTYSEMTVNEGLISGNIHQIRSEEEVEEGIQDTRDDWKECTTGNFQTYQAYGQHLEMILVEENLEKNVPVIADVVGKIFQA